MDLPLAEGVSKAGNPWKKKEWVMETMGNFPRKVKFDFFGERVDTNRLEIGKTYSISFDVESREYMGRWYTDIRAYASREITSQSAPVQPAPVAAPVQDPFAQQPQQPTFNASDSATDDLPF